MKEEQIELSDFLNDVVSAFNLKPDDIKPTTHTAYKYEKCGDGYDEEDKFCSKDGAKIIPYTYEILDEDTKNYIMSLIYMLSEEEIPKSFPYNYIDSIEKRGDGSGYYMNFIFQRKKDDKYFVYTSYDGRIEEDTLDETTKEVTTIWDFERYFD